MKPTAALFTVGLGGGVVVTLRAHRKPSSPWWDVRVGRSRLRRSDLPVVGAIGFAVVPLLRTAGRPAAASALAGFSTGAALGAVGTGLAEPLPAA